jgi:hypothetical protein
MTVKVSSIGLKGLEGYPSTGRSTGFQRKGVHGDCRFAGCLCKGIERESAGSCAYTRL